MIVFPIMILAISDEDDQDFMKQLYLTYHISMLRIARSLTVSMTDAEDAVSDACAALIPKISILRQLDRNILEGYVISTVKNAAFAIDRKRSKRRESFLDESLKEEIPDDHENVEIRVLERASLEELMRMIQQLPEEDQVLLRMKFFQHANDDEIAKVLGVKEVSVRSRLSRVRAKIARLMQEAQHE